MTYYCIYNGCEARGKYLNIGHVSPSTPIWVTTLFQSMHACVLWRTRGLQEFFYATNTKVYPNTVILIYVPTIPTPMQCVLYAVMIRKLGFSVCFIHVLMNSCLHCTTEMFTCSAEFCCISNPPRINYLITRVHCNLLYNSIDLIFSTCIYSSHS